MTTSGAGVGDGVGVGLGTTWTLVFAVDVLLAESGSDVIEATVAVLVIVLPPAPFTVANKVMVSDAPADRDPKEIVRLFPLFALHVPLPVEAHETKVTLAGRLSVTTTVCAGPGPALLTASV
jgi:hypothetical protein